MVDHAVGVCGAKMGRLAELRQAGVTMPKGFTVTVDAYRWHCEQAGLDARRLWGGLPMPRARVPAGR